MESIIQSLVNSMNGIPKELIVFIISMTPVLELRGGLIAASLLGIDIWKAIPICIVGNILPIPFILLFIERIFKALKNTRFVKLIDRLEAKAEKGAKKIMKYKTWGLFLFVGIPLPGTGAWTGCLIAAVLEMDRKKAFIAAMIGIFMASIIMMLLSFGVLKSII